jgi:hypothetical protein
MVLTSGDINGANHNAGMNQYVLVDCQDGDGLKIQDWMASRFGTSALTTLAAPLNPGDTTITLASSANWGGVGSQWYQRQLVWWPWIASLGIYGYQEASLYNRKFMDFFGYAPKLNKKLLSILDRIQVDVLVTTAPWNEGVHYWNGKRVVIIHDLFNWPLSDSKLEFLSSERDRGRKTLEMLAFANYVVCESIFTEKRIKEARRVYNLNNNEIFVASLPPGFRPASASVMVIKRIKGLSYWFIPSHITPLKNQEVIINALIRLKKIGQYPNIVLSFPSFSARYMLKLLIKIQQYAYL